MLDKVILAYEVIVLVLCLALVLHFLGLSIY